MCTGRACNMQLPFVNIMFTKGKFALNRGASCYFMRNIMGNNVMLENL